MNSKINAPAKINMMIVFNHNRKTFFKYKNWSYLLIHAALLAKKDLQCSISLAYKLLSRFFTLCFE